MRAILIDWLVDVHLKFKLKDETLYLTVALIDRYLSLVFLLYHKVSNRENLFTISWGICFIHSL